MVNGITIFTYSSLLTRSQSKIAFWAAYAFLHTCLSQALMLWTLRLGLQALGETSHSFVRERIAMTNTTPPSRQPRGRFHTIKRRPGFLVILGIYAILILLVSPVREFPLNDDWLYAHSVQYLLETGQLRTFEWTAVSLVLQVYWGALFSLPTGFSFTALRISTLVMSLLGSGALYLFLRELDFDETRRLVGTLVMAVNPLYLNLSYTFMTDVPFTALVTLSLWLYVRGFRRGEMLSLVLGSAASAGAFLIRQTGLLVPAAALLYLLMSERQSQRIGGKLLCSLGLPLLTFVGYLIWIECFHTVGQASSGLPLSDTRSFLLTPWFPVQTIYRLLALVEYLAIFTLPLLVATLCGLISTLLPSQRQRQPRRVSRRTWSLVACWLLVFALFAGLNAQNGQLMPYLGNIIESSGSLANTLPGDKPPLLPSEVWAAITLLSTLAAIAFAVLSVRQMKESLSSRPISFVYLAGLLIAGQTLIFARLFDRYLLVLLPTAIVLVLQSTRRWTFSKAGAITSLVAIGIFSLVYLGDYLAWNQARWEAGRGLLEAGVPVDRVDGGYEWNAWFLFEEGTQAELDRGEHLTWRMWEAVITPEYALSFSPLPGYGVVRRCEYPRPLSKQKGAILVLEREGR